MKLVKARAGILLFILIILIFFLCLSYALPSINFDKKIVLSSVPQYVMLYISLFIHLSNYIEKKYFIIKFFEPKQIGWNISAKIYYSNLSEDIVMLNRISSLYFKTNFINHKIEKKYSGQLDINLETQDIYRDSPQNLTEQRKISIEICYQKYGTEEPRTIKLKISNPFYKYKD